MLYAYGNDETLNRHLCRWIMIFNDEMRGEWKEPHKKVGEKEEGKKVGFFRDFGPFRSFSPQRNLGKCTHTHTWRQTGIQPWFVDTHAHTQTVSEMSQCNLRFWVH